MFMNRGCFLMTKKDAVIVYGAGISGRGAAQVLADRKQQVYLYNDMTVL